MTTIRALLTFGFASGVKTDVSAILYRTSNGHRVTVRVYSGVENGTYTFTTNKLIREDVFEEIGTRLFTRPYPRLIDSVAVGYY